jgi:hypothetical protein
MTVFHSAAAMSSSYIEASKIEGYYSSKKNIERTTANIQILQMCKKNGTQSARIVLREKGKQNI